MKNRLILGITLLLSTVSIYSATPSPDYATAMDFIKDFFDKDKHTDKPMTYWYTQIILITHGKEGFARFNTDLKNALQMRNAKLVGLTFVQNKDKFKDPKVTNYIKDFVKKHGTDTLIAIIQQRMNAK